MLVGTAVSCLGACMLDGSPGTAAAGEGTVAAAVVGEVEAAAWGSAAVS